MSYRTYINGREWLGNNEAPQAILDELKRQGCPFDAEWCTPHDEEYNNIPFEIKDLNELVKAAERAILEMVERRPEIADFNGSVNFWKDNLTYGMAELRNNAYIFWSSRLLDFVGEENYIMRWDGEGKPIYELKPGAKCLFEAH